MHSPGGPPGDPIYLRWEHTTPPHRKFKVRVYSAAKTVADCFKYRNKVGIDVAIEALRDTKPLTL